MSSKYDGMTRDEVADRAYLAGLRAGHDIVNEVLMQARVDCVANATALPSLAYAWMMMDLKLEALTSVIEQMFREEELS